MTVGRKKNAVKNQLTLLIMLLRGWYFLFSIVATKTVLKIIKVESLKLKNVYL